ncbi:unnamed protein product [Cylicostephanus goldi]|uniref:Mos1 transposase HTH domain-containing protein n=1 Tax=Cylicostephanus goldi TaxID=71465 RepID=A0A3P6RUJ1_CYLGO|nr:unnamed protein product [Cylicostephanus goldi]
MFVEDKKNLQKKKSKQDFRQIYFYEFSLGTNAAKTARKINLVWGESVNESTVRRWFQKFRSGDTHLEDKEGRGRPTHFDEDRLKAIVENDPHLSTREIAEDLGVGHATVGSN